MYTLALIAIDRFLCITRPMSPWKLNPSGANLGVISIWGFALLMATFPLLGWNDYVPEGKTSLS